MAQYQLPKRQAAINCIRNLFPNASSDSDEADEDVPENDGSSEEELDELISEEEEESGDSSSENIPEEDHRLTARDGSQWSDHPFQDNPRGRQPQHNLLREASGPVRQVAERAVTPAGALSCFLTPEIIGMIARCTNEEGQRVFQTQWRATTAEEIHAYLGLVLLAGVYRGRMEPVIHLWSRDQGRPIFSQTMPRGRFQQLTRVFRFDSKDTRTARRERDKMAPIREIHDKFATTCRTSYKPGSQLCVDEQLVVFRGRCPFRVYIPSKPGKYGMKVWLCCDVDTAYVCNMELYIGREGRNPEVDQAFRVVLQMTSPFSGSGRGVTGDNFFTSLHLAQALLQRQMTYCGTVRKNRRFLPPVILDIKQRQVNSSVFAFSKASTLVSYMPKKGKNVILLSTQHHNGEIPSDREDKKPEIILHYNRTKGAVDTLDKLVRTYSCQRKSRRWPMVFFQNMLDIAAYNAAVVYFAVNPDFEVGKPQRRRLFLEKLAMEMITATTPTRAQLCLPPQSSSIVLGVGSEPLRKRARCGVCPRTTDRKTVEKCTLCLTPICKDHARLMCNPSCSRS